MRPLSWVAKGYLALLFVVALLHLGVEDRIPFLAILYYVTPPPVFAALLLPVWLASLWGRRWIALTLTAVAIAGLVFLWRSTPGAIPEAAEIDGTNSLRILQLNTQSFHTGTDDAFTWIAGRAPDLVVLIEAGIHYPDLMRRLQGALPELTTRAVHAQMFVALRGTFGDYEFIDDPEAGLRLVIIDVELAGEPRRLFVVDILSNPLAPRQLAWRRIAVEIAARADGRSPIVAGDFNTPLATRFAGLFRRQGLAAPQLLHLSAEDRATWPDPVPLLSLDQVWLPREEAAASRVRVLPTGVSDHHAVEVDLRWPGR
jgi:endonuclease/exonuclease/phosphatase (EEP) superfamily protein YafD